MRTTVSSKGRVVFPAGLRRRDRIVPGQEFEVERIGRGEYRLSRCEPRPKEGQVDRLLACPAKGYFAAVESESTA